MAYTTNCIVCAERGKRRKAVLWAGYVVLHEQHGKTDVVAGFCNRHRLVHGTLPHHPKVSRRNRYDASSIAPLSPSPTGDWVFYEDVKRLRVLSGYIQVPVEPTIEMWNDFCCAHKHPTTFHGFQVAYKAMLAKRSKP